MNIYILLNNCYINHYCHCYYYCWSLFDLPSFPQLLQVMLGLPIPTRCRLRPRCRHLAISTRRNVVWHRTGATTWKTHWKIRVISGSGPFTLLRKNIRSSTKPEVHNNIILLSEKDQAMAIVNMYKKFGDIWMCSFWEMWADRQNASYRTDTTQQQWTEIQNMLQKLNTANWTTWMWLAKSSRVVVKFVRCLFQWCHTFIQLINHL